MLGRPFLLAFCDHFEDASESVAVFQFSHNVDGAEAACQNSIPPMLHYRDLANVPGARLDRRFAY